MHELHRVLLDAADGRFPPVDGDVDDTEVVTIGSDLVDRLEVSVEVFRPGSRGAGRRLIVEALGLVPVGRSSSRRSPAATRRRCERS